MERDILHESHRQHLVPHLKKSVSFAKLMVDMAAF